MMERSQSDGDLAFSMLGARLRRRWYIVVLCLLLGAAAGYEFDRSRAKEYHATSTILVYSLQASFISADAINSYAQLVTTDNVLRQAAQAQNPPLDIGTVRNYVSVTVPPNTDLISIAVTAPQPRTAAQTANSLALASAFAIASFYRPHNNKPAIVSARTVNYAVAPSAPYRPKLKADLGIGLLVGVLVSLALALMVPDSLSTAFRRFGAALTPRRVRRKRRKRAG